MLRKHLAHWAAAWLFALPVLAAAQNDMDSDSEKRWLRPPDERRAYVKVTNDWRDTVRLTMWTRRGTQIGDSWVIRPGQSGLLREGGQKITAQGEYGIRVGDDPGIALVQDVGQRQGSTWYINVRDVWRVTHEHGGAGRGGYLDQR